MAVNGSTRIADILQRNGTAFLSEWTKEQLSATRREMIKESELREQSAEFLRLLQSALQSSTIEEFNGSAWTAIREFLTTLSRSRSAQGFTPTETATFVFSFKAPLFDYLRREYSRDAEGLAAETWVATRLIDRLGLWTAEAYQKSR